MRQVVIATILIIMKTSSKNKNILHLESYWPYQITVLADRIARRMSKIVKEHELNLSQWRVLAAIADKPGRTSVDVVTITPMDKGIVSRATQALLKMGLIRREASQIDGRISHLHLTEKGSNLYNKLIPQIAESLKEADECLSQSAQQQLDESLRTLIKILPDLR